jgi:HSP20 family protein
VSRVGPGEDADYATPSSFDSRQTIYSARSSSRHLRPPAPTSGHEAEHSRVFAKHGHSVQRKEQAMADTRGTQTRSSQSEQGRSLQRTEPGAPARTRSRDPFDIFGFGPFSVMRRMREDMDRLFGDAWGGQRWPGFLNEEGRAEWAPAIEAFQRGNEFVVRAELPGMSREDLAVEIGDDALTIQGERKYDHREEREGVVRSERSYGSFCRVVPLPEGAVSESAKANFKDGVLEIVMEAPSHEVRRGRRIEIGQEKPERVSER